MWGYLTRTAGQTATRPWLTTTPRSTQAANLCLTSPLHTVAKRVLTPGEALHSLPRVATTFCATGPTLSTVPITTIHTSAVARLDFYDVLGVSKDASEDDIKAAYRKLAKEFHPDQNKDPDAGKKFSEINEAYSTLKDSRKRQEYDMRSQGGFGGAGFNMNDFAGAGFSQDDIFSSFADMFGGRGSRRGPQRGADLTVDLVLDFMEAVRGCDKEVTYSARVECDPCTGSGAKPGTSPTTCSTCHGSGQEVHSNGFLNVQTICRSCRGEGSTISDPCSECSGRGSVQKTRTVKVTIPEGVDNGVNIRLTGRGDAGEKGGPPGHVYVTVRVKEDDTFLRDGPDVRVFVPISVGLACLGGEIIVPTLDGDVELKVPRGTQPDTIRVLRGRGIPYLDSKRKGDQFVQFKVVVPDELTERQEELMKEFVEEENKKEEQSPSFLRSAIKNLKKKFSQRFEA